MPYLGIILLVWLVFYFVRRSKKPSLRPKETDNPYVGLRNMALHTTPSEMGIDLGADPFGIYGVVMDLHLPHGTISLVCFLNGDTSMYTSTGGGILGGGRHDMIKTATITFVQMARSYLKHTVKTESAELPDDSNLQFCFLTVSGIFIAQESFALIDNNQSVWRPLFDKANEVVTALRTTKID